MKEKDLLDLDHLMMNTFDHRHSEDLMKRLGFVVRPVRPFAVMGGGPSGGSGGSLVVLFKSRNPLVANFMEFALCDRAFAHPSMLGILGGPEGFAMAVHSTSDADRVHARWSALGYDMEFWKLQMAGNAAVKPADLKIVMPKSGQTAVCANAVQWADLTQYNLPEFLAHPNTAGTMLRLTCIATAAAYENTVAGMSAFYGFDPVPHGAHAMDFCAGETGLRIMRVDEFRRRFPGIGEPVAVRVPCGAAVTISVREPDVLRKILDANRVQYADIDGTVCVSPHDAAGIMFEFVQAQ